MCISFDEAQRAALLSADTERSALEAWQDRRDPDAAEALIRSHARMVHALARRWRSQTRQSDDVIAAGMHGLLVAAERFDLTRPVRFSTYARWWVQTMIQAEVAEQTSTLSLPVKAYHDLLAGRLDGPEREAVAQAIAPADPLEFSSPEDGLSLAEVLPGDTPSPEDHLLDTTRTADLRALLAGAIAALPEPYQAIMTMRSDPDPMSHADIAECLDCSVTHVRSLEENAYMRLRRVLISRGQTPAELW